MKKPRKKKRPSPFNDGFGGWRDGYRELEKKLDFASEWNRLCAIDRRAGLNRELAWGLDNWNLRRALKMMLEFWDQRDGSTWTAHDVKRIEEIRKLVNL